MLPIHLPSRDSDKEIRLGLHDVLAIEYLDKFLSDIKMAHRHGLEIPSAIQQIPALVFFSDVTRGVSLDEFLGIVEYNDIFQRSLPALKNLRTLVFCCEDRRHVHRRDRDCFSDYTANFDPNALKPSQSSRFNEAKDDERSFKIPMQQWMLQNHKVLEAPDITIVAKDWPVKRI
jgi:hypothetical protein